MKENKNIQKSTLVNKAIYLVVFAFLFIFPAVMQISNYTSSNNNYFEVGDYSITSFNVDINVNEKNVFTIEESITINPYKSMRGIIRAIPIYQKVSFKENNKTYNLNYKTKISNVTVNEKAYLYEEDGFVNIRIGDANTYFIESKTYDIKYTLDLGDDRISEFDQLYFNIIGTDWDVPISDISFTITMPKALEANHQLFVYSGEYGSASEQTTTVLADQKTFSYSYVGNLAAYQGLTVKTTLEEGYFDFSQGQQLAIIISIIAITVFALLALIFIIKALKVKKQIVIPVVMFTSPDNLPPSELGYIIDGVVDNQDLVSLIVYWADKGYLKIKEDNKKYTLVKLKDIEEESYQKSIFNKIFEGTESETKLERVGEKIFIEAAKAKVKIKSKHEHVQFNIKNKNLKSLFAFFASALVTFVATTMARVSVQPFYQIGVAVLGFGSLLLAYAFMHKEKIKFKTSSNKIKNNNFMYVICLVAIWLVMAVLTFNPYYDKLIVSFMAVIPASAMLLVSLKLEIRNKQGLALFGEVLGFKQFIQFTEKDRIKMLAKENPEMFYTTLPYAYVLGVSEEWINKFEGIKLNAPSWYESSSNFGLFDYLIMRSIFNSIMISSLSQMSKAQMNSFNTKGRGGGGFGGIGGGFTGGGFGGGGGRGW